MSTGSTLRTPSTVAISVGKKAATAMIEIFIEEPKPSTRTKIGTIATAGVLRRNVTTGSVSDRSQPIRPISSPTAMPAAEEIAKPIARLRRLGSTSEVNCAKSQSSRNRWRMSASGGKNGLFAPADQTHQAATTRIGSQISSPTTASRRVHVPLMPAPPIAPRRARREAGARRSPGGR